MEIDVCQQGRRSRALRNTHLTVRPDSFIQHSSLQPFVYQTKHALIRDPMLEKADQPVSAQLVEKASDINIENPAHLFPVDSNTQRIQRIVLAALRSEAVRKSEEILLVNRTEHCDRRALDNLIFQCGDTQRPNPPTRLWNVLPPAGQRPVSSPLDPFMQTDEIALQVRLVILPRHTIHTRCRPALEGVERQSEQIGVDVVEKRGKPFLLPLPLLLDVHAPAPVTRVPGTGSGACFAG